MSAQAAGITRVLRLAWRTDRHRLVKSFVLLLGGYLATPLIALALREFVEAALTGVVATTALIALVIAVLLVSELMLGHFAHLSYFELGEQMEATLYQRLVTLTNGSPDIAHLDDPKYAETVTLVREELHLTRGWLESVLQLGAVAIQSAVTAVLLGLVNPWLTVLAVAALPPVLLSGRAERIIDAARERTAADTQRSRHLVEMATTGSTVKEIRLFRGEPVILGRQRAAWRTVSRALARAQARAAGLQAAGHGFFALAHAGALYLVVDSAVTARAGVGDVVLVVALAVQVSVQTATMLRLLPMLRGAERTMARMDLLRELSAPAVPPGTADAPARLAEGIRLRNVSFTYPGTDRQILRDVTLDVPAGSVVAVVGVNGAGKSTLVKLLCGLYTPTAGRITADGVDLRTVRVEAWRDRIAMLFQDFARVELLLRESVGIGDVERIGRDEALGAALDRARAGTIVAKVPGGLDGLLGRGYGDGTELSGGQWQTLGLARAVMRPEPVLLVLDEPAAALDATAEHALFERFAVSAEAAARTGAITLFTSHRFSTVRMADLIVVLDGGSVAEVGSHDELMRREGLYHELFTLQATAYV